MSDREFVCLPRLAAVVGLHRSANQPNRESLLAIEGKREQWIPLSHLTAVSHLPGLAAIAGVQECGKLANGPYIFRVGVGHIKETEVVEFLHTPICAAIGGTQQDAVLTARAESAGISDCDFEQCCIQPRRAGLFGPGHTLI